MTTESKLLTKDLTECQTKLVADYRSGIAALSDQQKQLQSQLMGALTLMVREFNPPEGTNMELSEDGKQLVEKPQE